MTDLTTFYYNFPKIIPYILRYTILLYTILLLLALLYCLYNILQVNFLTNEMVASEEVFE